jgi:hypothetical protein
MTLLAILAIGFAAAGLALVVRALVPTLWLLIKPFSCDLCMSWWGSVVFTLLAGEWSVDALTGLFGGVAVSVAMLKVVSSLSDVGAAPPPTLSDSPDLGDTFPEKE